MLSLHTLSVWCHIYFVYLRQALQHAPLVPPRYRLDLPHSILISFVPMKEVAQGQYGVLFYVCAS